MRLWQTVTVACSRRRRSAIGLPTTLLRPTTTARRPASATPLRRSSSMPPAGVLGTSAGRPSASRPALVGVIPSTSFSGARVWATTRGERCAGSGICTMTPQTSCRRLSATSSARSPASVVVAGNSTSPQSSPTRSQARSMPPM